MKSAFSIAGKTILLLNEATPNGAEIQQVFSAMGASVVTKEVLATPEVKLDGIVCCANITRSALATKDITDKKIETLIMNRVIGPTRMLAGLMTMQRLREGAAIVVEKNSFAHVRTSQGGSYFSAEQGLGSLAISLALQYSDQQIRVNTITTKAFPSTDQVTGFALAAAYLLSPASRWVTASDLTLTGIATM